MTPTTQSVCTCKVVSPRQVEDGECLICGKPFEPVAEPASTLKEINPELYERAANHVVKLHEPASTGEPKDAVSDQYGFGTTPERVVCNWRQDGNPPFNCKLPAAHSGDHSAARPSGPSAPHKSAIEIASERDLRVITEPIDWEAVENDAAPQTSAEPYVSYEQVVLDQRTKEVGYIASPQPVSGDAPRCTLCVDAKEIAVSSEAIMACPKCCPCKYGCTREEYCVSCTVHRPRKLAEPAPSPTPSVSTTQERLLKIADEIEQWAKARQKTLPSRGDWNRWPTMIRECAAAPSVAGTQPTPQPGPDFKKVRNIWPVINRYRGLLIDRKLAGTIAQDELTFLDSLQIFADWYLEAVVPRDASELEKLEAIVAAPAQGTPEPPKVEELAQEIEDAVITDVLQWRGKSQEEKLERLKNIAAILRPYFPPASQTPEYSVGQTISWQGQDGLKAGTITAITEPQSGNFVYWIGDFPLNAEGVSNEPN